VSHFQDNRYSNPIANRVHRKRQRLPTYLLIETPRVQLAFLRFYTEAFPASDKPERIRPKH